MWTSKRAILHTSRCLRNKSAFVKAQKPAWHHLKPQHKYRFNHDKLSLAGIFQRKERKMVLKNKLE